MSMRDQIAAWLARREMQAQQDAGQAGIPPLTGAMYPPEQVAPPQGLPPPPMSPVPPPPPVSSEMMQRPLPSVPPLTGAMYPKEIKRRK